jgi:hypothetical protein
MTDSQFAVVVVIVVVLVTPIERLFETHRRNKSDVYCMRCVVLSTSKIKKSNRERRMDG